MRSGEKLVMSEKMRSEMMIITNNCKVKEYYEAENSIIYIDGTYFEVLKAARDLVHKGHRLLTHPLSGSVKPSETPFKSVAVTKEAGALDLNSLEIIEASIATFEKFMKNAMKRNHRQYTESILEDFREVDFTLLESALR